MNDIMAAAQSSTNGWEFMFRHSGDIDKMHRKEVGKAIRDKIDIEDGYLDTNVIGGVSPNDRLDTILVLSLMKLYCIAYDYLCSCKTASYKFKRDEFKIAIIDCAVFGETDQNAVLIRKLLADKESEIYVK